MIDINIEIDPDLLGIDEKKSINILKSTLDKELISKAKINLIFAKDELLNNLKIEYFQKDHLLFRNVQIRQPSIFMKSQTYDFPNVQDVLRDASDHLSGSFLLRS